MPSEPQVLTVETTDAWGNAVIDSLVVRLEGGFAFLEIEGAGGGRVRVAADELRAALEPKQEIREAAA